MLLLLFGAARAGTVSLSGSCRNFLLPGNILNFTLYNSGNDTAYNLIVSPKIFGAKAVNSTYTLSSVQPGINYTVYIKFTNITHQGSYAYGSVVAYQQGVGQTFTAIFPCLINIGKPATSQVFLTTTNSVANGRAVINVSLFNAGTPQLNVSITPLLPPLFSFVTNSSYTLSIKPYSTRNASFIVTFPISQSTYTGAVSANYILNNVSYSTLALVYVNAQPSQASKTLPLLYIGIGVVILVLLILIILSLRRRRRTRKMKNEDTDMEAAKKDGQGV